MTTTEVGLSKDLQLAVEIEAFRQGIVQALNTPLLAEWPEDEKYAEATQPGRIAKVLIPAVHDHLTNASFVFLFREEIKSRDRTRLAKTKKAPAEMKYVTGHDFIMTINWTAWRELTATQRLALIDQQLAFCERDLDSGNYFIQESDVSEFYSVVRRWGLWRPDLQTFGETISQVDMFQPESGDQEETAPQLPIPSALKELTDREQPLPLAEEDDIPAPLALEP